MVRQSSLEVHWTRFAKWQSPCVSTKENSIEHGMMDKTD